MSDLRLVVVASPDKGKVFTLREGAGLMLGRGPDDAYRLTDVRVSRPHCEVRLEGGRVTVTDRESTGGTFVNRQRVADQALAPDDLLQVGGSSLRFEQEHDTGDSTIVPADSDARAAERLETLAGRALSHFQLGDVLGRGGNSVTFRSTDTKTGQTVALKVMEPRFSSDDEEMQRFVRAMKTVLPLDHPNIVRVLAAGKSGPYCWVSMDYVEGESLTVVIKRIGVAGMLDWKYAYRVAVHIGRALEYAHGRSIIHRGITPQNVLVQSADKTAKLADLMLAKALSGALAESVTVAGEVLGDMSYVSPERTYGEGEGVDARSDLFSLGATVYTLLTGRPPFEGASKFETMRKLRGPEPPARPTKAQLGIPGQFEGVVMKLLAKPPGERYQSATELLDELERVGRFSGVKA